MSTILTESKNYIIMNEYETVWLQFKNTDRKVKIGDFYGDPEMAIISDDESYCAIVGCGLIIYYLHEPFKEFEYNVLTSQWKELFRKNNEIWWINHIRNIDSSTIILTVEKSHIINGGEFKLDIESHELTPYIN